MIDTVSRITSDQVDHDNSSGRTPVVFIHGLWLLPHSWDRWIAEIPGRGHSLVIDNGWREVADKALAFVKRFVPAAKTA
jgi:pimeloyl-ACP methyl ester carboxylesterase